MRWFALLVCGCFLCFCGDLVLGGEGEGEEGQERAKEKGQRTRNNAGLGQGCFR